MRNKQFSPPRLGVKAIMVALVFGCITVIATLAWLLQPPVKLNEHGYDITLALYRVCNQRSVEGLARLEIELSVAGKASTDAEGSCAAITRILEKANRGHWADAERDCRRLLEDQVTR